MEIVFTSGTTADPKGVVLSHRNILTNLLPLEREIAKYLKYERLVHPLRFLNVLPLSHVFGQFLGLFIPQILGSTVIFHDTLNPSEIIRTIKKEKVSVLVTVPRVMETLQAKVERDLESVRQAGSISEKNSTARPELILSSGGGDSAACTGSSAGSSGLSFPGAPAFTPGPSSSGDASDLRLFKATALRKPHR